MKREVKIRIVGTQRDEYGEENEIELLTEGKFYNKGNACYLLYEESEISGMENSKTRLKIEENRVQIKRSGQTSSDMVFNQDKGHSLDYITPYGTIKMDIETEKLEIDMAEDSSGSRIELVYKLTVVDSGAISENKLKIEII